MTYLLILGYAVLLGIIWLQQSTIDTIMRVLIMHELWIGNREAVDALERELHKP